MNSVPVSEDQFCDSSGKTLVRNNFAVQPYFGDKVIAPYVDEHAISPFLGDNMMSNSHYSHRQDMQGRAVPQGLQDHNQMVHRSHQDQQSQQHYNLAPAQHHGQSSLQHQNTPPVQQLSRRIHQQHETEQLQQHHSPEPQQLQTQQQHQQQTDDHDRQQHFHDEQHYQDQSQQSQLPHHQYQSHQTHQQLPSQVLTHHPMQSVSAVAVNHQPAFHHPIPPLHQHSQAHLNPIYMDRMQSSMPYPHHMMTQPAPQMHQQQQQYPSAHHMSLIMRQDAIEGCVVQEKNQKGRKPIDPPPIVQLKLDSVADPIEQYLQNPYYLMYCTLVNERTHEPITNNGKDVLVGSLVSSLHRLKDVDNKDGGYFVFGDISCKVMGTYCFRFSLYELRHKEGGVLGKSVFLKDIISKPFNVVAPKEWKGLISSTGISRAFNDQGVRLRLRKEPRNSAEKSAKRTHDEYQEDVDPLQAQQSNGQIKYEHETGQSSHDSNHGPQSFKRARRSFVEGHHSGEFDDYNDDTQWPRQTAPSSFQPSFHPGGSLSNSALSLAVGPPPASFVHPLASTMHGSLNGAAPPFLPAQHNFQSSAGYR